MAELIRELRSTKVPPVRGPSNSSALFGRTAQLACHHVEVDGAVTGCALWFLKFDPYLGRHRNYVESWELFR